MEPKKNPKVDLRRNSGTYFVIGLAVVMFFVWRGLEWKTYDKTNEYQISMNVQDVLDEEVPTTEQIKTPPPPAPPAAPEIIEVVEDAAEIEETVIESTESSQDQEVEAVVDVDDVEVGEEEEEISVPFAVIEDIPVFPGCEQGTKKEKRACFQQKIQEHVAKKFKYPEVALEMGIEGKVYVQFVIDTDGRISQIRTRGPDKLLEAEAERIISTLPRMVPGKQRGRAVKVPYSIPIGFKLL